MPSVLGKSRRAWPSAVVSGVLSISALLVFFITLFVLFSIAASLKAQEYSATNSHDDGTQRWLLSRIPSTCCVTNRRCF
jgi:hypothetical protein